MRILLTIGFIGVDRNAMIAHNLLRTIYCALNTGNAHNVLRTIYCALFIGAPAYCHNATIHYALFIMLGFIVAAGNPRFTVIYTIHCVYCGYCDLLGCAGNPLFHAIYIHILP